MFSTVSTVAAHCWGKRSCIDDRLRYKLEELHLDLVHKIPMLALAGSMLRFLRFRFSCVRRIFLVLILAIFLIPLKFPHLLVSFRSFVVSDSADVFHLGLLLSFHILSFLDESLEFFFCMLAISSLCAAVVVMCCCSTSPTFSLVAAAADAVS